MALVDFGGASREVCLDYVPEAAVGEYCIVHAGFAISLLSEDEAEQTLSLLSEIDLQGGEGMGGLGDPAASGATQADE
jgi:hydrogenase expression/formation protein HypC